MVRNEICETDIAQFSDRIIATGLIAKGGGDGGAGFQEINIDTSLPAMPGGNDLAYSTILLARPSDLQILEFTDTLWAVFT